RVASSSGCATKPKAREIGWTGYAGLTQHSLRIGHYVMATAEHREPCDSRGSCTVLGAPGGEIPPGDSAIASDRNASDPRGMSALLRKQTNPGQSRRVRLVPPKADICSAANCALFDHLVGAREQGDGRTADLPCNRGSPSWSPRSVIGLSRYSIPAAPASRTSLPQSSTSFATNFASSSGEV